MIIKSEPKHLKNMIEAVRSIGRDEAVMKLKENRWLVMSRDGSNVLMTATRVPRQSMEEYDKGGYEAIGLPITPLNKFITKSGGEVTIEMDIDSDQPGAIHITQGRSHAKLANIDVEGISGRMDGGVKVDWEVTIASIDTSKLSDFSQHAQEVIGVDNFYISCREEGMYLFARGDNGDVDMFHPWDEFEDGADIDWSVNNPGEGNALVPKEDKGTDVIISAEHFDDINMFGDTASLDVGNHIPIRLRFQEGDSDFAYIQAPRIDMDDRGHTLPEDILKG